MHCRSRVVTKSGDPNETLLMVQKTRPVPTYELGVDVPIGNPAGLPRDGGRSSDLSQRNFNPASRTSPLSLRTEQQLPSLKSVRALLPGEYVQNDDLKGRPQ
jgi:hypothetical protein